MVRCLCPRCVLICSSWVPDGSSSSCSVGRVWVLIRCFFDLGVSQGAGPVLRGPDAAGERAQGRLRRRREAAAVRADSRRHGGQLVLFPHPFLFSSALVVHFSLLGHSKAVKLAQFHIFAQLMKPGSILTGMITALKFE